MFEAVNTATGQRLTLKGSRWSGLRVERDQCLQLGGSLSCVNPRCDEPVVFKSGSPSRFVHASGGYCAANAGWGTEFTFWVATDVLGQACRMTSEVQPAAVVLTKSGMRTAVRPAARLGWKGGRAERRADSAAGASTMWLVHEEAVSADFSHASGWLEGLLRQAIQPGGYPLAVGILKDRQVKFVGDIALEPVGDELVRARIVSTTAPVSVEALRFWCHGKSSCAPPEYRDELAILDAIALRRISVQPGPPHRG